MQLWFCGIREARAEKRHEAMLLQQKVIDDLKAAASGDIEELKKLDISRNNLYTMDISAVAGMIDLEELNLERSKVDNIR